MSSPIRCAIRCPSRIQLEADLLEAALEKEKADIEETLEIWKMRRLILRRPKVFELEWRELVGANARTALGMN
jgi:hypothetical protein